MHQILQQNYYCILTTMSESVQLHTCKKKQKMHYHMNTVGSLVFSGRRQGGDLPLHNIDYSNCLLHEDLMLN